MIKGIKHIIFDLGGVLLNIDFQRATESFKKLGLSHFEELYSQLKQASLFDDFETGKMPVQSWFYNIDFYQSYVIIKHAKLGVKV